MTDFIATVTASVVVLYPFSQLKYYASGQVGVLVAAPAVGAIVTGLVMGRYGTGRRPGVIMLISVAIYGAATLAFGVSRAFWISLVLSVISGSATPLAQSYDRPLAN